MHFDQDGTYNLVYIAEDECGNTTLAERVVEVFSLRTVLYPDGTFIINEKSTDQATNEALHGVATDVYDPFDPNGEKYILRFRSNGSHLNKIAFVDDARGKIEMADNDEDIVLIKSDGLPTYHFAHLVDDHLMRTTHVIRGQEWVSSVPIHHELFKTFGFKLPKYVHTPLILKKDGDKIRKISKRLDPEARMTYYEEKGYPVYSVIEAIMTIANSNYEAWRDSHPDAAFTEFEFSPKKMSASGALFDLDKLDNISKNYISKLKATEVFDLLEEYGVVSVAGNSEYYNTIGTKPFTYFYPEKEAIQEWTASQLGPSRINKIKLYPASIDILVGNKKVALCHFANDVRWDYHERSTHTYQSGFVEGETSKQFLYTNSDESKKKLNNFITTHKKHTSKIKGHVDARNNPIFGGKMVTSYDSIIQGHVHFHMEDFVEDTEIYTLRAVGMGYDSKKENSDACYYVLKETKDGSFEIEKRLVPFNKNSLLSSIYTSGLPHKDKLLSYVKSKS